MAKQNIQTRDITALAEETGNLYETVVVLSRRARQIAARTKAELDQKLSYFDDLSLIEPGDDLRVNEDQLKISLEYEKQPKSGAIAMDELQNDQIYYRNAGSEDAAL
ncbi:MAG: DNA-directed RNA polymerase subunit omega [Rhodothermaceae bacterium]|nr:DNA-directed RNA polymerase subunit omega [Rhodothermaceae bacterium]